MIAVFATNPKAAPSCGSSKLMMTGFAIGTKAEATCNVLQLFY